METHSLYVVVRVRVGGLCMTNISLGVVGGPLVSFGGVQSAKNPDRWEVG